MPSHIVSRVVSSIVCVPDENDPNKTNTYNIVVDTDKGTSVKHDGKVVNVDALQLPKDKAFIEHEILQITFAIQSISSK